MDRDRRRIGEFDIAERLSPPIPPFITQLCFGIICTLIGVLARGGVDLISPAAGPFSLIYPTILFSTLFGRWLSGAVTLALSFLHAWYFVLPAHMSFDFVVAEDAQRTIINGVAAGVILLLAELFRRAVRRAVNERKAEVASRDLLLREIDHRIKNNFAIVASLLSMQEQRQTSEEARQALSTAAARVHSIAAAHTALYSDGDKANLVQMTTYLGSLTQNLSKALFVDDTVLRLEAESALMPRDLAVAIGLIVNEAVTNASKHAFRDIDKGEIIVTFEADASSYRLQVADNGRGIGEAARKDGLGSSLIEAFAKRAGGELNITSSPKGTNVELTGSADAYVSGGA